MKSTHTFPVRLALVVAVLAAGAWLLLELQQRSVPGPTKPTTRQSPTSTTPGKPTEKAFAVTDQELANALLQAFLEQAQSIPARQNEAILTFRDRDAWLAFQARAAAAGLRVLSSIEKMRAVRVRFGDIDDLARELASHGDDYADLAPNTFMSIPLPPPLDQRDDAAMVPLGNRLLAFLGVEGASDSSDWGRGVTIAIIDAAVAPDPTFGNSRIRVLDLGIDGVPSQPTPGLGHGTAVTALAAGASPEARGVAPAADVLAIPVIAEDGLSDAFTVSQGIITAVDAGAQVINLSLGSDYSSGLLEQAVDYAVNRGVMIVAAAGNSQSSQLSWPAADPRVISVGAVDAIGQQVTFSNSGPQLQITAPGYGVQTAWTDNERVLFDGTSASAPIITGAIAAVMSETPGTTAAQAWEILRAHTAEAGPAGPDPDFGNGIIDLGWALARDDFTRVDTAVASHVYDPASNTVEFVVQNRSNNTLSGLKLEVSLDGTSSTHRLASIGPGATGTISLPLAPTEADTESEIKITSRLINPPGVTDAAPENNERTTLLSPSP